MNESQQVHSTHVWDGEVTWRRVAELRELLLDELDTHADGLLLDVRKVTSIDRTGVALLIGANMRAKSLARRLTLGDDADGVVTAALRRAHVINDFTLAQAPGASEIPNPRSGNDEPAGPRRRTPTVPRPTTLSGARSASTLDRGRSPARESLPEYGLFGHGPEYTVGVEEEFMLVDADSLALVPAAPDLLRGIDDPEHIKPEIRQSMIEAATVRSAGFSLGSDARPGTDMRQISESQEALCPNMSQL